MPKQRLNQHKLKADENNKDNPGYENRIQSSDRNTKENSGWNEDVIENLITQLQSSQKVCITSTMSQEEVRISGLKIM